jgi:hypothetical protein
VIKILGERDHNAVCVCVSPLMFLGLHWHCLALYQFKGYKFLYASWVKVRFLIVTMTNDFPFPSVLIRRCKGRTEDSVSLSLLVSLTSCIFNRFDKAFDQCSRGNTSVYQALTIANAVEIKIP